MKASYKAICSIKTLPQIREFVKEHLEKLELQQALKDQLVLAVDEACANNIIHQHDDDGISCFDLVIYTHGPSLCIEIRDKGKPFPIDQYEPKQVESLLKEGAKGGLGIALITKIMDKVEVVKHENAFTYKFTKHIQRRQR